MAGEPSLSGSRIGPTAIDLAATIAELDRVRARLEEMARGSNGVPANGLVPSRPVPQMVTLDQAAAIVHRSKRTLEKYLYDPALVRRYAMPPPSLEGGGGRPHEWEWSVIRPWLERVFRRPLPERVPGTP